MTMIGVMPCLNSSAYLITSQTIVFAGLFFPSCLYRLRLFHMLHAIVANTVQSMSFATSLSFQNTSMKSRWLFFQLGKLKPDSFQTLAATL